MSSRPDCIFKFTSCVNQDLVGCIPIAAVGVHLNLKSEIGQSSHKMYSNNIVNFQESTTTLDASTEKVWKLIEGTTCIYKVGDNGHSFKKRLRNKKNSQMLIRRAV